MQFNLMASRCGNYKISNLVTGYGCGMIGGDEIIGAFRKGYSAMLISMIIDSSEVLRTFSGLVFEKKIAELSKVNDDFEKLTRQEIYLKILCITRLRIPVTSLSFPAARASACATV